MFYDEIIKTKGRIEVMEDLYFEILKLPEDIKEQFISYLEKLNNQDSAELPPASPG